MSSLALQIPTASVFQPLLQPSRYKGAKGGRGSGKSHFFAEKLIDDSLYEPGLRSVCIREVQKSLKDSAKRLIEDKLQDLKLGERHGFKVFREVIETPGDGIILFQGMQDHTAESIKSLEGFVRAWVEEAQTLSATSLQLLRPTIRKEGSELWFSWNPRSSKDPIDMLFCGESPPTDAILVTANWRDNPWFTSVLEQERQDDYANLPRATYDHVWEGGYSDTIPDAIILPEWFDACVDAHIKLGFEPLGQELVAYDPADTGDDKAVAHSHGSVILDARSTGEGRIDTATDWATTYAIDRRPDAFTWDADGMGAGLKRQITEALTGKKIEIEAFRGSEAADRPEHIYQRIDSEVKDAKSNRETFVNRRAQYYWLLRDRMYRTFLAVEKGQQAINPDDLISFSSGITELSALRSELCRIPRKYNNSGRIQLLSKPEMKKQDIDSPNLADAVMMLMRQVDVKHENVEINFVGWG